MTGSAGGRGRGGMRRGPAQWMLTGAVAAALAVAAGCGGEPDQFEWPDDPTPAPPAATATLSATEARAVEAILTVVDGFRQVETGLHAAPEPAQAAQETLGGYLADPLLGLVVFEIHTMHARHVVRDGAPTWDPAVVGLRLDDRPPAATVRDCWDTTGWPLLKAATGEPASGDGLRTRHGRQVVTFTARLFDEDRWLLEEAHMEEDEAC